uniref:Uncharacterized protein n=1 Tax=Anguilla anguilla TaxID=7936 RepID=A0A0E9SPZ0_ANGAN
MYSLALDHKLLNALKSASRLANKQYLK